MKEGLIRGKKFLFYAQQLPNEDVSKRNLVGSANSSLAQIYLLTKQFSHALKHAKMAVSLMNEASEADGFQTLRYKAIALEKLGSTHIQLGELETAKPVIEELVDLLEYLSEANPNNFEFTCDYGIAITKLGEVYEELKLDSQSNRQFQKALEIFGRLLELDSENSEFLLNKTICLEHLSMGYMRQKDFKKAIEFAEKTAAERRRLMELEKSQRNAYNFALAIGKLADCYFHWSGDSADSDEKTKLLNKSLAEYCKCSAMHKNRLASVPNDLNTVFELSLVSFRQALIFARKNQSKKTESKLEECLQYRRILANQHSNKIWAINQLLDTLIQTADFFILSNDFAHAEEIIAESLEWASKLKPNISKVAMDPRLVTIIVKSAIVNSSLANHEKASKHALRAAEHDLDSKVDCYNLACVLSLASRGLNYSLNGERQSDVEKRKVLLQEKAVKMLGRAIKQGWNDFEHIKIDADLDALRGLESFQQIIDRKYTEAQN